jgi:flagellar basal-body rod protein FlgF
MDRLLYIAMSGAKETMRAQAANNHNLANASTTGFRGDLAAFQSQAVSGSGYASRVYATHAVTGWDDTVGAHAVTGRDLDVAIQGDGFIAVQAPDGREAYTRAGDLRIDPSGLLMTATGHPVLSDGGPLTIPPHSSLTIAKDGTVSLVPLGQGPQTTATVGRIKLVNPDKTQIERTADGLFRQRNGVDAEADAAVRITAGALESSNVNIANAMVQMIELARRFEMQVKTMRNAEDNSAAATRLLRQG